MTERSGGYSASRSKDVGGSACAAIQVVWFPATLEFHSFALGAETSAFRSVPPQEVEHVPGVFTAPSDEIGVHRITIRVARRLEFPVPGATVNAGVKVHHWPA